MAKEYHSKKTGLALAIPLAGLMAYGCAGIDPQPPNGRNGHATVGPTPTPVLYEDARTYLLNTLNPGSGNFSQSIADLVRSNGDLVQSGIVNQKALTKKIPSTNGSDNGRTYVATITNVNDKLNLNVKVFPMPGFDYFDIEGIKFSSIEFTNENVGRGDIFDSINFAIIDPYRGNSMKTDLKPAFTYHAPEEEKMLSTRLGKHLLKTMPRI